MVLIVLLGGHPVWRAAHLVPDGLNSRGSTVPCPHPGGETSATLRSVGHIHVSPSPDVLGVMGHMWTAGTSDDIVNLRRPISDDVNTVLLQYPPNLLNIIHIHAGNTNAALELAITVLNDFELKRDTVQTKNDFPAQ